MRLTTPAVLQIRLLKDNDNFSKLMRVSRENYLTANKKLKENKENLNGT